MFFSTFDLQKGQALPGPLKRDSGRYTITLINDAALLFGALLRAFVTNIMRAVVVRWSLGVWLATSTSTVGGFFFL